MVANSLAQLAFASALEQAQLIRTKQISPLELLELYLERIEQYDSQVGSFYHVARELALAEAKSKTEQLTQVGNTNDLPPFWGVPIGIKDLKSVAGMPLSYGVGALKEQVASYDEGIVSKIKAAGFVILGKTATSQLGSFPFTEPPGFPPTRNPWNLAYTPGGSSGGSAAAVAAGFCPLALGGDAGGSVRGPAACCGLVGLKPSRGRLSMAPVGDRLSGLASHGVLTRTVADTAAFLDCASGYLPGDPYWLELPQVSFLEGMLQGRAGLKIAYSTELLPVGQAAVECQSMVTKIIQELESLGHELIPQALDFTPLIEPFTLVWASAITASGVPEAALSPMNQWVLTQSGSAGAYLQAVTQMQLFARELVQLFEQFDLLLTPTYMHSTIKVGEWNHLTPEATLQQIINWILPCPPFNVTGQPAVSIPAGFDAQGVPFGVQLVGQPNGEATLLALANQLEQILAWPQQYPSELATSQHS